MTGRDALLQAFDELFDVAAMKLSVRCTADERAAARAQFEDRLGHALELTQQIRLPGIPVEVRTEMREAIERLSPADVAGIVASIPLAQQTADMVRTIALAQAEQRMLEHLAAQADTTYGGN